MIRIHKGKELKEEEEILKKKSKEMLTFLKRCLTQIWQKFCLVNLSERFRLVYFDRYSIFL